MCKAPIKLSPVKLSPSTTPTLSFSFIKSDKREEKHGKLQTISTAFHLHCLCQSNLFYLLRMLVQYVAYIVQEGSADKVITKITTTQNMKSSHAHRRIRVPAPEDLKNSRLFKAFSSNKSRPSSSRSFYSIQPYWYLKEKTHQFEAFVQDVY